MRRFTLLRAPLLVAATLLTLSGNAQAGGFLVYEPFNESMARAGAVVANADKPTAVWFNPAGLAFQSGLGLTLGAVYTTANNSFEPKDGGDSVSAVPGNYVLPHLFVAAQPLEWMTLGIGTYSVYGLGTEWPEDWFGREFGIYSAMTTLSINPSVAFRIGRSLGIGLGFDVVRGAVETRAGIPEPVGGEALFGGEGWGYGFNAGVAWQAIPNVFHVGASYRSRVSMDFTGRIDYSPPPEFSRDLRDQDGEGGLTMPDIIALGVSYWPLPSLELALDGVLVNWATYDVTKIKLADGTPMDQVHDYHASWVARLGVEWDTPLPGFVVRGGVIYDQSPAPSDRLEPTLPDADQVDFTCGVGYDMNWLAIDLAYQLAWFLPSEATGGVAGPEGTYKTLAHMVGLGATLRVGQ